MIRSDGTGSFASDWKNLTTFCLFVCLLIWAFPVQAQLPGDLLGPSSKVHETSQSISSHNTDTEEQQEAVRQNINDVRLNYQELRALLAGKNPPSYASRDELTERQIQLFSTRTALESWLNSLINIQMTRQAERDLENKIQSWAGFGIEEPYPLSLVDQLYAEKRSKSLELSTEQARASLENEQIPSLRKSFEQVGPKVRKAAETLEKAREKNEPRLRWLLESAVAEQEMIESRLQAALANVEFSKLRVSFIEREIDFLDEKLTQTQGKVTFSREDLDARLNDLAGHRELLSKKLEEAERLNSQAQEQLVSTRASLEKEFVGEGSHKARISQLFDLHQIEADTASQSVETFKILLATNNLESIVWQERFRTYEGFEKNLDLSEAIRKLDNWQERISEFSGYYASKALLTRTQIQAQNEALKNWPEGQPGKMIEEAKRDAYQARLNDLELLNMNIETCDFLTRRLRIEIAAEKDARSFVERLQISLAASLRVISSIWEYEVFSVDDTIIADGKVISGSRPVTLKKLIYGLLLLTVGIWLAIKLSRLLGRLAQKHLDVERSLIQLFEKFGQYLAIFIVVVVALGLVQIPLTAFAFLGGALAIGVGFGGQNLINNFMSSLILLIEKPIKVGDAVEIGGVLGRVTVIGGRCSTIRRYDGVDLLVPNSQLLEQTVVNRTLSDHFVRYEIKVGVAYGSPTREVFRILEQVVDEHGLVLKDPKPVVLLEDFAADALLFGIYYWIEVNERLDARVTASDLRHRIDRLFRDAGICIAFPQRDVHLDSDNPLKIQLIDDSQPKKEPIAKEVPKEDKP